MLDQTLSVMISRDLLLSAAWKATALVALAWLLDLAWLRRRLLAADVLWTAVLLGLVALPVGALALPRATLPIWEPELPVSQASVEREQPAEVSAQAGLDNAASSTAPASTAVLPIATRPSTTKVQNESVASSPPAMWTMAIVFYFAAFALLLGRLVWGLVAARRLVARATPIVDERWLNVLTQRQNQLGVLSPVKLLASGEATLPFVTGWKRPAIVVPTDVVLAADEATIEATLVHELTHIARRDYPIFLITKVAEVLYWWNPLVWLAAARLRTVREAICDSHCCWRLGSREKYGSVLLAMAARLTRHPAPGIGLAMARGSRLRARLENLSASGLKDHSLRRGTRAGWLAAGVALGLLTSSVALGFQETKNATVADVVAALEAAERSIQGLSGVLHLIAKYNFVKPGNNVQPNMIEDDAVSSTAVGDFRFDCRLDGTGRIDADLVRTHTNFEGAETAKRLKIVSLFDGVKGKYIETQLAENGAELHTHVHRPTAFMTPNIDPLSMTTLHIRERLSALIAGGAATILREETFDDRPTVVVELAPKAVHDDYIIQQRLWIDVERGVAMFRETMVQRGEGKPWGLHYRIHGQAYEEFAPGVWLPKTISVRNYVVAETGQDFLSSMDQVEVKSWQVNASLAPIQIEGEAPANVAAAAPVPATIPEATADSGEQQSSSGQLKLIVTDEAGQPLAGADVHQNQAYRFPDGDAAGQRHKIKNADLKTDAAGEVVLTWEGESVDLRIWVSHAGRVPLHASWARDFQADGGNIPADFRFVMLPGTRVSGVVQDEAGRPIAGAEVEIYNLRGSHFSVVRAGRPPGVRPVPVLWLAEGDTAIETDAEGRWEATNIPSDADLDLAQVAKEMRLPAGQPTYPLRLRVTHEDFDSYEGENPRTIEGAPSLADLRSGEAVVVLRAKEAGGEGE